MKSLKLLNFLILTGLSAASAVAGGPLPAYDPNPTQREVSLPELLKFREADLRARTDNTRVAIPTELYSYYAEAGFKDPDAEAITKIEKSGNLAFCHSDKWSSACLTGLMIYRCGQYAFPLTPFGCALAVADFSSLLELKRIDVVLDTEGGKIQMSLPVIFTKRLEKMIQDRTTQSDLRDLRMLLEASIQRKSGFDLWEWFRAMSGGDLTKTMENMAVLLQDTSPVEIGVKYLRQVAKSRRFSSATMAAINELSRINGLLDNEVLTNADYQSWLHLYPRTKSLDAELTPLIYHFYPMAFLARKLQSNGHGARLAAFLPFLFNTEYLNQDPDVDQRWPFKHPLPFTIDEGWEKWKMRDMYGGYAGALWGVQKTNSLKGLPSFQSQYAKKPYATMRALFWSMPNP